MRLDRGSEDDAGGWVSARLSFLRNIGWGARGAVAFTVGAVGSVVILVNALSLQTGPHPAPLFKAPLAAGEATNTVAVAVPRPRPAEPALAKVEAPAKTAAASAPPPAPAAGRGDA